MSNSSRMIIGFSGKRGVGKTQSALYLARKHGFKVMSFGNALRDLSKQFFPFTPADFLEKNKEKPYGEYDWSPRDFMISLGKLGRYYDEDFWVKKLGLAAVDGDIAVDDVRFPNEVSYLKAIGGKIVRLERYENLNIYGRNLDDPSETSLDKYKEFDYTVDACWNLELGDLHSRIKLMMAQFKEEGYGK